MRRSASHGMRSVAFNLNTPSGRRKCRGDAAARTGLRRRRGVAARLRPGGALVADGGRDGPCGGAAALRHSPAQGGYGVPKSEKQVLHWYRQAAEHGHADAAFTRGGCCMPTSSTCPKATITLSTGSCTPQSWTTSAPCSTWLWPSAPGCHRGAGLARGAGGAARLLSRPDPGSAPAAEGPERQPNPACWLRCFQAAAELPESSIPRPSSSAIVRSRPKQARMRSPVAPESRMSPWRGGRCRRSRV